MNWVQAQIAMDTGERVRNEKGTPCIVVGVIKQRKVAYNEYKPYCVGEFYYTARVMEAESRAPCIMDVRPEDLRTETEYLEEIKKQRKGWVTNNVDDIRGNRGGIQGCEGQDKSSGHPG